MRKPAATLALLLALAFQPVLAGGWERREAQRPPPPPRQMYAPRPEPQRQPPQAERFPYQQPPRVMSSGQAAQRAQQMTGGGRVLAVDPAQNGYRVRVLKDGEVRSVFVPPQ
jgi:hypothetical protein